MNKNTVILAALGLGAFWMLTRRPTAYAPGMVRPAGQPSGAANANAAANLINAGANVLGRLFGGGGATTAASGPRLIANDDTAGQPGYGWQYFDNGTAIAPNGTYYHQGQQVWAPDAAVVNPPNNVAPYDAWQAEYNAMVGL